MSRYIEQALIEDNPGFLIWAGSQFTSQEVETLFTTVATSYDIAHELLPIFRPVRSVRLGFTGQSEIKKVSGSASREESKISITLPSTTPLIDSLNQIPDVMVHEVAHITHHELNPTFYTDGKTYNPLWLSALAEGVAIHTSNEVGYDLNFAQIESELQVIEAVKDALYTPALERQDVIEDFLVGDSYLPSRGYKVGRFVLARFAESNHSSLHDIFKTSPVEFTNFIESLVA